MIELLIALAVGGIVLLLVARLATVLGDSARQLALAHGELEMRSNGRRWLQASLSSHVTPREDRPFDGDSASLRFSARIRRNIDAFTLERITVVVRNGQLVALTPTHAPFVLRGSVAAVHFDYMGERGLNSPWSRSWLSPAAAPVAVRVRVEPTVCVQQ